MSQKMHINVSRRCFWLNAIATGTGGTALLTLPSVAESKDHDLPCMVGRTINQSEIFNDDILGALSDGGLEKTQSDIEKHQTNADDVAGKLLKNLQNNKSAPELRHMLRREQQEMINLCEDYDIDIIPKSIEKHPTLPVLKEDECPNITTAVFKYILEAFGARVSFKQLSDLMVELADEEKILDELFNGLEKGNFRKISTSSNKLVDLLFSKKFMHKIAKAVGDDVMPKILTRFSGRLVPFIGYALIISDVIIAATHAYDFFKNRKAC